MTNSNENFITEIQNLVETKYKGALVYIIITQDGGNSFLLDGNICHVCALDTLRQMIITQRLTHKENLDKGIVHFTEES